jgi:F-type H+-transporting ATPase subunit delta
MSSYNVSSRYAFALIELAEEKNIYDKVIEDIDTVYNTLKGSRELRVMLSSPIISEDKKKEILSAIFGNVVGEDVSRFLSFIVDKGRINLLEDIAKRILEINDEKKNIVNVTLKSVFELDSTQVDKIKLAFENYTGKNVRFKNVTDDSIIGGFVAQVKDTVFDASVKRQLERLKETLIAN